MKQSQISENVQSSIDLLIEIVEDRGVPKNIRNVCDETKKVLVGKGDEKVKIDTAIQNLDLIADNMNIPTYTRMQIWSIVSLLESA